MNPQERFENDILKTDATGILNIVRDLRIYASVISETGKSHNESVVHLLTRAATVIEFFDDIKEGQDIDGGTRGNVRRIAPDSRG